MSKKRVKNAYLNPDRPLDLENDKDRLSFSRIANIITDIVKKPERPYTFGLFGKWGTGKSTILKYVEKSFKEDSKYAVVSFDAWKYEGDALRRSFLIDISKQLENNGVLKDGFTDELEQDTYNDQSHKKDVGPRTWKEIGLYAILIAVALTVNALAIWLSGDNGYASNSVSIIAVSAIVGYLVFVLNPTNISSLFVKNINITKDKLSSPEEFYNRFRGILDKLSEKNKSLVVIIDNLDRTQKDATVKLLGTIKTFLNSDKGDEDVVFIIASDQDAIKRHIKSVYANGNLEEGDAYESEEFLKKFFNAIIELPPYISSEYIDYIGDLVEKTNLDYILENKDNVVRIVELAYPDNPRGAKQFVNNLVVFLLMIDSIGAKGGVDQEFIKSNINFITSMLVLRDKFAEIYEAIRNASLNDEMTWNDIKNEIKNFYGVDPENIHIKAKDYENFYKFTESWAAPENDSVRWFFTMRRSKEEIDLPNWDLFIRSLDKADDDTSRKYLDEFFNEANSSAVKLITSETNVLTSRPTRWNTFIISFIFVYINSDEAFRKSILKILKIVFRNFPPGEELEKISNLIDFNQVLAVTDTLGDSNKQEVNTVKKSIKTYIDGRNNKGHTPATAEKLQQVITYLNDSATKNKAMAQSLMNACASTREVEESLLEGLANLNDKYPGLASSDLPDKVASLLPSYENSEPERSILRLKYIISSGQKTEEISTKVYELMNALQNVADQQTRPLLTGYVYDYLKTVGDVAEAYDMQFINSMTNYLHSWYSGDGDFKNRKEYIPLLLLFANVPNNPQLGNAQTNIDNFIENAPEALLFETLAKLDPEEYDSRSRITAKLRARLVQAPASYLNNETEADRWITYDELGSFAKSVLDNLHSLPDFQKFEEGIELAFHLKDHIDEAVFLEKLMTAFENSVDQYTDIVSTHAYRMKDNPLRKSPDRLRELKRRIQEIKNPGDQE